MYASVGVRVKERNRIQDVDILIDPVFPDFFFVTIVAKLDLNAVKPMTPAKTTRGGIQTLYSVLRSASSTSRLPD
jgi:hypothetical protein